MDKETALKILRELHDKALFSERTALETLHPELKESEDERIRKHIISVLEDAWQTCKTIDYDSSKIQEDITWLKKQESVGEIVERCKTSWYNEGKIDGMAEGLTDDEKYQQGWHYALEKQGEQKPQRMISAEAKEAMYDKPAWSEKDEQHIDSLLKRLDGLCRNEFERTRFAISEDKDWLKSLKQRIGG